MALVGFIGAVPLRAPDVGMQANQVPLNSLLGKMAYADVPARVATIRSGDAANLNRMEIGFEYVNNTTISIKMRGYDGVTRGFNINLA